MALFPCGSANGGGGGGSTVVPNPTGEAVGELTSIGIDGNKYSISGGGGAYTTTVLFTNGASGDTTFQLSSAYTNFDAIAIYYSHFDGQDQYEDVKIYPTTFLNSVSSTDEVLGLTNDVWYYYFSVYSTTEFRYVKSNAGYITDIIGIKYGSNSGGGGAGYTETTLFTGTHQTYNGEITLNDDLDNYDLVIFWTRWTETSTNCEVPFFANVKHFVDTFIYNNGSTTQSSPHMGLTTYDDQYLRIKMGSAKNKLLLFDSHSVALTKVVGLKYSGGGTDNYNSLKNLPQINGTTLKGNKTSADLGLPSVAANPTGEAVGELTSIDINGSKYSIPESSEYEETTLWTGSGNMLSSFTATIANPYTDYDALRFEYESGNESHNYATHYEKLISKDTLATPEWFSLSDFYLPNGAGVNSVGKFTDTTHLSVQLNSVNWFTSCTLTKIVGIKYGNGVGGGGKGTKDIYSNSETLTNKVWLGLPVYRKIFVFDEPIRVGNSWVTTPADVSDLNIDYTTDAIIIGKDINHPDDNALCVTAVVNGESKKIDMAAPGYNCYVKMICIEYVKKHN